ncbi:MAG: M10 family metallopeptidase C-terminal domain-containing protein, partial [Leptolyngbyaceae cyanobacterium]
MVASYVKALLHKNGIHWNNNGNVGNRADMGAGATVTYSFISSRPAGLSRDHYKNFSAFSNTQKAQIRTVLSHYEDVANIRFSERSSGGTLSLGYADTFFDFDGDGDFEPAGGLATRPHSSGARVVVDKDTTNFSRGTWGYQLWLHELGHAVGGLNDVTMGRNPNDQYAASSENRNKGMDGHTLSSWQDNRQYTIMSYIGHPDMPGVRARTLGLYDIAAIQTLYGANWSYNSGHNNYSWNHDETFIETIWDGGGNDTINASNQTRRSIIDLRAGRFSSIGSLHGSGNAVNNLAIAYGATIENAFGGSGNDRITGNNVRNIIFGNNGNDFISGNGGDDFMDGG